MFLHFSCSLVAYSVQCSNECMIYYCPGTISAKSYLWFPSPPLTVQMYRCTVWIRTGLQGSSWTTFIPCISSLNPVKFHHRGWAKLCSGYKRYMKPPKRYSLPDCEAADQTDRWSDRQTGTDRIWSEKKKWWILSWLSWKWCSSREKIGKEFQGLEGKLKLMKQRLPTGRKRKVFSNMLTSGPIP